MENVRVLVKSVLTPSGGGLFSVELPSLMRNPGDILLKITQSLLKFSYDEGQWLVLAFAIRSSISSAKEKGFVSLNKHRKEDFFLPGLSAVKSPNSAERIQAILIGRELNPIGLAVIALGKAPLPFRCAKRSLSLRMKTSVVFSRSHFGKSAANLYRCCHLFVPSISIPDSSSCNS